MKKKRIHRDLVRRQGLSNAALPTNSAGQQMLCADNKLWIVPGGGAAQ